MTMRADEITIQEWNRAMKLEGAKSGERRDNGLNSFNFLVSSILTNMGRDSDSVGERARVKKLMDDMGKSVDAAALVYEANTGRKMALEERAKFELYHAGMTGEKKYAPINGGRYWGSPSASRCEELQDKRVLIEAKRLEGAVNRAPNGPSIAAKTTVVRRFSVTEMNERALIGSRR